MRRAPPQLVWLEINTSDPSNVLVECAPPSITWANGCQWRPGENSRRAPAMKFVCFRWVPAKEPEWRLKSPSSRHRDRKRNEAETSAPWRCASPARRKE
ncbi:MAG: hypothetical protein DMF82_08835 [Acidobacteria bacterium]|nr:MAG: hypothetical protein DMF82_08835 [Acidobacteriota bacterium]